MNNGYSICMNRWALDKDIKNELGLLLIISSLCAEKGYCFASNKYLADLFNITDVSISMKIKKLEEKGYIEIEYKKRGCEVISREIRLKNILTDDLKKFKSTIKKDFKDNNISINNTSNNIYSYYEEVFTRTLNPIEYEMITKWLEDKTYEQIKKAIDETAKSNIDNLKYVEKVLYSNKQKKNKKGWDDEFWNE